MAADGGRHPLIDGCPPEWVSAWGEDEFGGFVEFEVGGVTQRMRWIRPGAFLMGSPEREGGRDPDEVQHEVTLTQGYWLADTPVTQALWQAVTSENPSRFKGDLRRPVEQVSWEDCQRFCARLREQAPGPAFRLPTEAEWEYACRAGTRGATYAEGIRRGVHLKDIAWYADNSQSQTHPVGEKLANPWGLHDMLGNVWEWCSDWLGDYSSAAQRNPTGADTGVLRVIRGGSWIYAARRVRAAFRFASPPGDRLDRLGLRLVRDPEQ